MNALDCKILTSEGDVRAVADNWRQLHANSGWTPFTCYEWFDIWWYNIGKPHGWMLHVVTGHRNGLLVALLPLAIEFRKGLRLLQWAGAEWFDYCDVLAENPTDVAVLWQATWHSHFYDLAVIRDVRQDALSRPALETFAWVKSQRDASYLDMPWHSGEAWLESMPKKKRSVLRRRTNQMETQKGPVKFEISRSHPISDALLDTIMQQKTTWLEAQGHKLLFSQPGAEDMFRKLVHAAAAKGNLFLGWLTCGGEVVAGHICFIHKDTLYSYQSSYEQSLSSYSPGTVLLMNMISHAVDQGVKRFDHMRGAYAYKDKYSSGSIPLFDYEFSGSLKGKLVEFIQKTFMKMWRKSG